MASLEADALPSLLDSPSLHPDFQALFDASPTPMLVVAPRQWTIVAANAARLQVTGTTREDQIGRGLFEMFPDDPADPAADGVRNLATSLERVVATRTSDVMAVQRYAIRGPDGCFVERWWSPLNSPVLGPDGEVALIIHSVEDVTEVVRLRGAADGHDALTRSQQIVIDRLRASEAALRSSESRYEQIVEGAEDFAIVSLDAHGVITSWNTGAERITGFPQAEAVGQPGAIIFTPEDRTRGVPDHEMHRAQADGKAVDERWHLRRDGSRFWGSGLMMPLGAADGGFLKIFRDRTAEHEGDIASRASEAMLSAVVDAVPVGIIIADAQGRIVRDNAATRELWGVPPETTGWEGYGEWVGYWPDTGERIKADEWGMARALLTGEVVRNELVENQRFDTGERRVFLNNAAPVRDDAGHVIGGVVAAFDITDRLAAERRLRDSEARQRFRVELGDALRGLTSPSAIMATVAERLGTHLAVDQANYYLIDGDRFVVSEEWRSERSPGLIGSHRIADFGPEAKRLMKAKELLRLDDTRGADGAQGYAAAGMAAVLSAPLHSGGRWAGGFHVHSASPRAWTDEEAALVRETAERAWAEMERARAEAELRESESRQRFRVELGDALRGLTSPSAIMLAVAERLGPYLGVDKANYYATDGNSFAITEEWRTPAAPSMLGTYRLADFGSDAARILEAGGALRIDDTSEVESAATFASVGMAAVLSVPLHRDGRWVAGLHVHQTRSRVWTDEEEALLREVASQAWAAVERSRAEAELRDSEEFNRRVLASSSDCIKVLSLDGRLEFMSEGGMGVMEVEDFADIQGAYWPDLWQGDEHPKALAAVAEAKGGGTVRFQGFARTLKGSPRWWDVAVTPVNGSDGQPEKLLAVSRDITEQRQAEERLRELNETLEARVAERTAERNRVWEMSRDLLAVMGFDGYLKAINPAWETTLGIDSDTLLSLSCCEQVHPDDVEPIVEQVARLARGETIERFENRLRHADGTWRWISWTLVPEGDVFYAVGRDVTVEKAREVVLAERTAELRRFHDIVDATVAPICAFDTDLKLLAFNRAHKDEFRRVNGFDCKIGDVFPDLFIPEQAVAIRALMTRAVSGEAFTVAEAFGRPEFGTPVWEIAYTPLKNEQGEIVGAFHHAMDISERLAAEAELEAAQDALRQAQKMEAMGQLTGGVAHDFNNLLTPIIGSLDMLLRKGVGSERERRLMDGALQSAERAKTLVQRLLAFARRQPLQPVPVDLARLVPGMADLMASTLGPAIDVQVKLAPDLPPAKADPNQLEMALLNLAVNARDAMPGGGTLTVTAERTSVRVQHPSGVKPGHYVRLGVRDTGTGMDADTLRRAVEPFFSTKGVGKGTGLGLSMVHGLAAQLGGGLTIDSAPGEGTTVELWLPLSAEPIADGDRAAPASVSPAGRGTALLVDDEELVRMSTADMLNDLGFTVIEAGSAEDALHLLRSGAAPDLLVTDHLMPGMTGADLAREARVLAPGLPVLVVSGYAEVDGIDPDLARLTKPFRSHELAASVAALVPGGAGG